MSTRDHDPPAPRGALAALTHLGPGLAYAAFIFMSGTSQDSAPPGQFSDKTMHFVAFGIMVPLAVLAFGYLVPRLSLARRVAIGILVSSALGALLELVQSFLPYRSCEMLDWIADTAGALMMGIGVIALASISARLWPRSRSA